MILTGSAISKAIATGDIVIDPLLKGAINPNSVNYRLGEQVLAVVQDCDGITRNLPLMPKDGRYLLESRKLYLGHTLERIGSRKYVASLIGRSSIGRLGLFVQVSANLGHTGAIHQWTLELVPAQDIYVYPGQVLGQVSFWTSTGRPLPYHGWFGRHSVPMPSKCYDPAFEVGEVGEGG